MSEKYELIDAEYAAATDAARRTGTAPRLVQMCTWLGVSRSGFYEWRARPQSATAARRELLKVKLVALFEANHGTYGYRRMHADLVRGGERVGLELVRRLMREAGPGGVPAAAVADAPRSPARTRAAGGRTWWAATSPPTRPGTQAGRGHHLHPDLGRAGCTWPR